MIGLLREYPVKLCTTGRTDRGSETLTKYAKNRNSSAIRKNARKYPVIIGVYNEMSGLRLSANPLYS